MTLLQIGYVVDAVFTAPVAWVMLFGNDRAAHWLFGDGLPASHSIRTTLGSLWMAILICSAAGVALPLVMAPVLILQLIYKTLWIVLFAIPRWLAGRREEVPLRVAGVFAAYVLVYPWIIPWRSLLDRQS
ncbi:MAG: hypothetical protein ACO1RT_04385 [Planctomycetaceae bacterium]